MARRRYGKAFKEEACKLITEQKQEIAAAARDLGVAEQTLRYWLVQRGWTADQVELPESDDPRWLRARIRDLEQRLRRAEIEVPQLFALLQFDQADVFHQRLQCK